MVLPLLHVGGNMEGPASSHFWSIKNKCVFIKCTWLMSVVLEGKHRSNVSIEVEGPRRVQSQLKEPFKRGVRIENALFSVHLNQAYKFDLFSTTSVSWLVEPLSFFLEFCHKAGNFEEINEFLSKKIEFIEGSEVFWRKMAWISGKGYFCSRNILISFFSL